MDDENDSVLDRLGRLRDDVGSAAATLDGSHLKRVGVVTYFSVYAAIALGGWAGVLGVSEALSLPLDPTVLPTSVAWGLVSLTAALLVVGVVATVSLRRDEDRPASLDGPSQVETATSADDRGRAAVGWLSRPARRAYGWAHERLPDRLSESGQDRASAGEDPTLKQPTTDGESSTAETGSTERSTPDRERPSTADEYGDEGEEGDEGDETVEHHLGDGGEDDGDDEETHDIDLVETGSESRATRAPLALSPDGTTDAETDDAEILEDRGTAADATGATDTTDAAHPTTYEDAEILEDRPPAPDTDRHRTAEDADWPEEDGDEDEADRTGDAGPDPEAEWPEEEEEEEEEEVDADPEAAWPEEWVAGDEL